MNLDFEAFKQQVESKKFPETFLVLHCITNAFLAKEYIDQIAVNAQKTKVYFNSIIELTQTVDNIFSAVDHALYIIYLDNFNTINLDFSVYKNVIIVCQSITPAAQAAVIATGCYVKIPELSQEEALKYILNTCPGLDSQQRNWLYNICEGDIYKISNQLVKLKIFKPVRQQAMFNQLNAAGGFNNLSNKDTLKLVVDLLEKNPAAALETLAELPSDRIEGFNLIYNLRKNLNNLIKVKFNPNATEDELGMPTAQVIRLLKTSAKYSNAQLIDAFDFITALDAQIKSGELLLSPTRLIDYIICGILSKIISPTELTTPQL